MYLWKCWRESRSAFLIVLGAMVANSALSLYVAYDPFGWIAAKAEWPRILWRSTAQALMLSMVGVTPIAGFVLGSLGVGTEFEKRTADFLFTRPRSRRYFLWMSWAFGAAQMIALVIFSLTAVWIADYHGAPPRNARVLLAMSTIALTIYSLTYLMTTLSRNSRYGFSLGVIVFMAYTGIYVWLKLWYEINIPIVWELTFGSGRRGAYLGISDMFGWLAVCLALTFIAQFAFERQEV